MRKLVHYLVFSSFLLACNKEAQSDQLVVTPDTIVIGHPKDDRFKYYRKRDNAAFIVLKFLYSDNKEPDMKIMDNKYSFIIDESKPMIVKLIGFKDSAKYIPVIVDSEYIQADSTQDIKDFYRVKLLKDTVDVDFVIDCGHGKIKLLRYPQGEDTTKVVYDSTDMYRIGYGKFVRLKK